MRIRSFAAMAMLVAAVPIAAQAPRPQVSVKTADYEFSYGYPAQAAAIPALAAYFEADRARARAEIASDAAEGRRESRANKFPFNPYELIVKWSVVTETPRLLSLSGDRYSVSGGAHGGSASDSLLWDKARRMRLRPGDLFVSPAALWSAVCAPYCRALDAERAKRRGQPVAAGSTDPFDTCPALKDLTVLLGSSDRKAINRIGLIADQYIAGSYAEGPYEITLPVTAAVIAAAKPEYRAAFAVKRG